MAEQETLAHNAVKESIPSLQLELHFSFMTRSSLRAALIRHPSRSYDSRVDELKELGKVGFLAQKQSQC